MNQDMTPDNSPERGDQDNPFGEAGFGQMLTQFTGNLSAQMKANMDEAMALDLNTTEGKLRKALIDNRIDVLTERMLSPEYISRKTKLHLGLIDAVDFTLVPGNENGEISADDIAPQNEMDSMLASLAANPEMIKIEAMQAAYGEAMTAEAKARLLENAMNTFQDNGMVTGGLEKITSESTEEESAIDAYREKVFQGLLEIAQSEGLEVAVRPDTYRSVARKVATKQEFLTIHLDLLSCATEKLQDIQDVGRIDGSEVGSFMSFISGGLSNNGQMNHTETLAMYNYSLDADYIYGDSRQAQE